MDWQKYLKDMGTREADIVLALLGDLNDRRGLRHEFDAIDGEIKKEICDTWVEKVQQIL